VQSEDPPLPLSESYEDAPAFSWDACEHNFTFYPGGADRFAALLDLIETADKSLHLFFYMFQADDAGNSVRDALVAAAKRGVDVRLIVDDFGSDAPDSFFEPLIDAGAMFRRFSSRWSVRYLIRNHQKFVIADGTRVITGGFNVSDHYFKPPSENGWCDLGVRIEGAVVERFAEWFAQLEDWVLSKGSEFRAIRKLVREWDPGDGPVQLVLGGPTRVTSAWARRVDEDMMQAQRLDLSMAYFSPPKRLAACINLLGHRGAARLVMAGKTDNGATIGASRALYGKMLRAGVSISEFQPCKLHMKLIVIDDIAYFGSANLDFRSIKLNLELMVRVKDAGLADRLRQLLDHMETHSTPITDEWYAKNAGWWSRTRWRFAYWLVAAIDYTVTRRLNFGF
jgi:cardiolipin synthase